METIGFWMIISGWLLGMSSLSLNENGVRWIGQKLRIPWLVQIFAALIAMILVTIGLHIWCLGNQGRYPGYPLDLLIEWLR